MKFITNKISTSKSSDFSDFVKKLAASNPSLSKTASTGSAVTKEANIANFGDKKANPFGAKKEDAKGEEKNKEGEEKESCDTDCEASGKEVKVAKDGKKEKDGEMHVKMQEMDPVGGTNTGKAEGDKKKEAGAKLTAKKASNSDVDPANKGVTHKVDECCGAPTSKSDDGSEGEKQTSSKGEAKKEEPKEEKKEASARNFVRIANLDSKTKNEWKKYWKNLYPTEYVEAMFADK